MNFWLIDLYRGIFCNMIFTLGVCGLFLYAVVGGELQYEESGKVSTLGRAVSEFIT